MILLQELQTDGFNILPGMDNDLLDQLALLIKHGFDGQVYDVSNISPLDALETLDLSPLGDFWLMTRRRDGCICFYEKAELFLVPLHRRESKLAVIGFARVDDKHIDVTSFEKTDTCYDAIFDAALFWTKCLSVFNLKSNRTQ